MAENVTAAPWELPYPSPTGEVKLGATDFKELAERIAKLMGERWTTIKSYAGAATLKAGELAFQNTSAATFTLPAASANIIIGIYCGGGALSAKVTTSGGAFIFGDFITGSTATIALTTYQHVTLTSDGTNWFIVAGEPKREQVYSARAKGTSGKEEEPSATRPTQVILEGFNKGAFAMIVEVGGVVLTDATTPAEASGGNSGQVVSFICPPGIKWKATLSAGTLEYSYLQL